MNPYAEETLDTFHTGFDLFGKHHILPAKKGQSERGELLKYFAVKIGKPVGFVAMKCAKLELADLYFLKSSCDGYEREGKGPWAKAWYGSLKVR